MASAEMAELARLIGPGNTQPGGFYRGDAISPRCLTPRSQESYENLKPIGDQTFKSFGHWVQPNTSSHAAAPAPATVQPPQYHHHQPPQNWNISEDMMNQK